MNTYELEEMARFWNLVQVVSQSNSQACWNWVGACNDNGYGVFGSRSGPVLAHRYAASLMGIDAELVRHQCDNPCCVRPSHLEGGTQADNMQDMQRRGRRNSRLDIASVRDIRTRRISRREFARLYDISEFTVGQVQRRETWAWLA